LSPYLNGDELPIEAGLPLGLVVDLVYPESHFEMTTGDSLTLLSDGVVEARDPQGQLFGFDRTRALSEQSAADIATAAQQFGQEDDITVLKLRLVPAEACST
jgi:serine phosphatase RsbU (regulator of sigma subunit)